MLMVISPAKTLDFDAPPSTPAHSQPDFLEHSQQLIDTLRQLTPPQLEALMSISPALADLNFGRNLNWHMPFTPANAKIAVQAFQGDVYQGLDAASLDQATLEHAQRHLRILSGLYGRLRPLDLIQPYRLEMGTRLANPRGANLYQFWGNIVTDALNQDLAEAGGPLVNLASEEYFKVVQPKRLSVPVITPVFKDLKGGKYKVVSFYAKRARGLMARYALQQRIANPEQLKDFDLAGYRFEPSQSGPLEWVFTRDTPQD